MVSVERQIGNEEAKERVSDFFNEVAEESAECKTVEVSVQRQPDLTADKAEESTVIDGKVVDVAGCRKKPY